MNTDDIMVHVADSMDEAYAQQISEETERSALARGSGISKRPADVIIAKMRAGRAIVARTAGGEWVGFSYIETWANEKFVSNSGLIVDPRFRNLGIARQIKEQTFELARKLFPAAKVFSITTGAAIMAMNSQLGFAPVTYDAIPKDPGFWKGCASCMNHDILESKGCRNCLCTAMLFDPEINQV